MKPSEHIERTEVGDEPKLAPSHEVRLIWPEASRAWFANDGVHAVQGAFQAPHVRARQPIHDVEVLRGNRGAM
jgi:hypothetical protein